MFYGISAIHLIHLKYKNCKRRPFHILCLISKVHNYKQLLHHCRKSTLYLQRLQKLVELIYRKLNGLYPSYLNDIIIIDELQQLRCKAKLLVPRFSTVRYGNKCISYLSAVLWNTLHNDIMSAERNITASIAIDLQCMMQDNLAGFTRDELSYMLNNVCTT